MKSKLTELEAIKGQHTFKKHGFSPDGPYAGWIQQLRLKVDTNNVDTEEARAVADGATLLEQLAYDYVSWISFEGDKHCRKVSGIEVGDSCHIKQSIKLKTLKIRKMIDE